MDCGPCFVSRIITLQQSDTGAEDLVSSAGFDSRMLCRFGNVDFWLVWAQDVEAA